MKLTRSILTAAATVGMSLPLLFSVSTLHAQQQRDEAKPEQQEARPAETRPSQEQPKASRPEDAKPADKNAEKPMKGDEKRANEAGYGSRQTEDRSAHSNQAEHTEKSASAGHGSGARIPEEKFRASFGRQHTFRVQTTTVSGRPNFQYSGYTFEIVNAWPVDWAYTDECYVDYVDGEYFLFDLAHPGISIALFIL